MIAIIKSRNRGASNLLRERVFEELIRHNGLEFSYLDVSEHRFWDRAKQADYFLFAWTHERGEPEVAHTVIPLVENQLGISCYPNVNTCWHYNDKIRQAHLMTLSGYPAVPTKVFHEQGAALEWVDSASFPLVFKLSTGAGSSSVGLVNSAARAKALVRKMFSGGISEGKLPWGLGHVALETYARKVRKRLGRVRRQLVGEWSQPKVAADVRHANYALFQDYLAGNEFDTRITVVGGRAFAYRRFNRPGDFRASGSGLLDHDVEAIDLRCVEIALRISRELKFQSMAYDFLFDGKGEPRVCEISYVYRGDFVYQCPGHWDEKMEWHAGHYWPEYFILMDLLGAQNLRQPESLIP